MQRDLRGWLLIAGALMGVGRARDRLAPAARPFPRSTPAPLSRLSHADLRAMAESWRTRLMRWGFNVHPTYWSTGGRVSYIAHDWSEVRVRLGLHWRTGNYVGTMFGGAMYSAVDPFYMIMLIKQLGPEYVVWDKAGSIRFRLPGRSTLTARFALDRATVDAIRDELTRAPKVDRVFVIELTDRDGTVCAVVEKTVNVRRRADPSQRTGRA